ncbi:class I SAM-dependent methyltransferase [Sphingobium sp. RAC03]|jgi:SAM-dependent methyltransferase|uniref:class I SAM-dependent methyltransferase n=1 Tax=Sphingobium sp. RAC03 TaxID=1843368 RepID=UPI00083DF5F7|nr:class I SAM-dependent methyltransferase [Sphingobium sp. RAC03]AOF95469.1 RNA cap guanine-N2 methyltransferase family protein [Sphingobium sp. RAC03]
MSKDAERAYLANLGEGGADHSLNKPFSDPQCGIQLASIGFIISLLPPAPAAVLDLGCGGGWTSQFLARAGYSVTGQDIAPDMIALAQENARINGVGDRTTFLCSDFEALDLDGQFDAALFFDALHHADDEALAIRSAYRALKPGGMLITHEPGEGHSQSPESIEAMAKFGVAERDMPPHLIIARGREAGFTSHRVLPIPALLHSTFYQERDYSGRWLSKRRWKMMQRAVRMLFSPDVKQGAIVVLTK